METELTRDVLKIFWDGNELLGITFYAYAVHSEASRPAFPFRFWPNENQVKSSQLTGEGWLVWVWDVRIMRWPIRWTDALRSTLCSFTKAGAVVAWCGLEGRFADPPDLFNPSAMAGGVYAAASSVTGFICHAGFNETFQPISDAELLQLRMQLL